MGVSFPLAAFNLEEPIVDTVPVLSHAWRDYAMLTKGGTFHFDEVSSPSGTSRIT